jgi:hypothetical protein
MPLEGLGKLKKFSDLILNQTRDLPTCNIVPQLTAGKCEVLALCMQSINVFSAVKLLSSHICVLLSTQEWHG